MKLFELSHITAYLWEHNLISPYQHGFLHGGFVRLQMLERLHAWCTVKNADVCSDIIYINLRKALIVYVIKRCCINWKYLIIM